VSGTALAKLGLAAVAGAICCAPAASAQKSEDPISVGYTRQVFVVKGDGGVRRVTRGPTEHGSPSWSPSGTRIALSASYNRIEVRDLAGEVRHEIRGGGQSTEQASWSPDSRRIAFVAYHEAVDRPYEGNLVVTSPDGSDRHIVATHADGRPAWSLDGRTLYYLHARDVNARHELWSIPSGGGSARRLASGVYSDSRVLVSPDGTWVLFRRSDPGGLWSMRASDGGDKRRLLGPHADPRSYGWAPGGGAIYGGKRKNHPFVTSLDGVRRTLGVRIGGSNYGWSPDGKRLAWVDNELSGRGMRVLSARPDGTGRRVVARFRSRTRLVETEDLEWSPGGRRFAIVPFRHVGD
jgi:Tol biopolymer transport system component